MDDKKKKWKKSLLRIRREGDDTLLSLSFFPSLLPSHRHSASCDAHHTSCCRRSVPSSSIHHARGWRRPRKREREWIDIVHVCRSGEIYSSSRVFFFCIESVSLCRKSVKTRSSGKNKAKNKNKRSKKVSQRPHHSISLEAGSGLSV